MDRCLANNASGRRYALAFALFLVTGAARAATCSYGSSGETSVQDYLNQNNAGVNATQCVVADEIWTPVANPARMKLVFEFAGYAQQNEFGIYDPHGDAMIRIFAGQDGPSAHKTLTVAAAGDGFLFSVGGGGHALFDSAELGFYLKTPHDVFYSQIQRNSDGFDHLLTLSLGSDRWLLGWEDLSGGGDRDFNDMGIAVSGLAPVPLPPSAWLLLSGLLGLAALRRNGGGSPRAMEMTGAPG